MTHELERAPRADDDAWAADLRTPCYVYEPEIAIERYRALKARLGTRLIVSLKANPNQDMLARCAHAYEDGVELASRGELDIVIGRIKAPRYLNNPSMDETFMRAGLASRCHFVLDNPDAVARFAPLASNAAASGTAPGQILLRLNAGALAGERARPHWHDHFGMTPNEAYAAVRTLAAAGLRVAGLHVFSGPHSFVRQDPAAPDTLVLPEALASLARDLAGANGAPLTSLSLGGGFAEDPAPDAAFERYRAALAPLAATHALAHEAGRAIFTDAGTFVTRIVAVKHWPERTIAVCDGGLSHSFLLAQTETVMRRLASPRLVRATPAGAPRDVPTVFVGSTCSRADVIGRTDARTPPPQPGDLALFPRCGAYHRTYSMSHFLSHEPAHVYVRPA
ncbi:PLP-dependent decarboxylase [Burkholderia sp. TSV86]|uniref:PLP-dependent decarboxylase n=1 Tax=Burkholderia sp. TSV86 TaxID=1385594 RepID=UPI00075DE657|nr:PLP-dependent decarboxylase [Burkholderia sp. TSV86]KVE40194.1 pyridoxal-dependent decarboxylase [Burkholderia sp. TSV86]